MPQSASTLIIGGGVMGASVAWHLTQRGERDVVIVDAASASGMGSTGRATGGFRAQFANAINVRLSLLSRQKLLRFASDTGVDPQYNPIGYLFLCDDAPTLDDFCEMRTLQRDAGLVEARELSAEEAAGINPNVVMDGVVGAAWCPIDGTIRPMKILQGYLEGAVRAGARVHWNTPVRGIERNAQGRITHVRAGTERIAVGNVVNAAGAWSASIAAMVEVNLPVVPSRRQITCSLPLTTLDDNFPMTIWARDAFHLRVRDGRALLNWPLDMPHKNPYALDNDPLLIDRMWRIACERVPAMRASAPDPAAHWVGLYEMSPDKTVILGRAPGCDNLVLVNGSSGHGVMHSPILGQLASEIVLDGVATTLDVHPLRLERFADGEPLPVSGML